LQGKVQPHGQGVVEIEPCKRRNVSHRFVDLQSLRVVPVKIRAARKNVQTTNSRRRPNVVGLWKAWLRPLMIAHCF
jgi:hypothetical protein